MTSTEKASYGLHDIAPCLQSVQILFASRSSRKKVTISFCPNPIFVFIPNEQELIRWSTARKKLRTEQRYGLRQFAESPYSTEQTHAAVGYYLSFQKKYFGRTVSAPHQPYFFLTNNFKITVH